MSFYNRDMNDERRINFKELVYYIILQEPNKLDEHFIPQSLIIDIKHIKKNKIFKMENIKELSTFLEKKMNFSNKFINYNKVILNRYHEKIDYDGKPYELYYKDFKKFKKNTIPKYNLFYNNELKEIVYNYYKKDFLLLKY